MVEDGAQAQMLTNIWGEACACSAFAISNEQKVALVLHSGGSNKKSKPQKKKRFVNGLKLLSDTAFWRQFYLNQHSVLHELQLLGMLHELELVLVRIMLVMLHELGCHQSLSITSRWNG